MVDGVICMEVIGNIGGSLLGGTSVTIKIG